MMSAQEIFDKVVTHLHAQGHRAGDELKNGFICLYKAPNGDKCAVGCLIPDDIYTPDMEGQPASDVVSAFDELKHLRTTTSMLNALQDTHDDFNNWDDNQHPDSMTKEMRRALRDVARNHHVSTGVLDSLV